MRSGRPLGRVAPIALAAAAIALVLVAAPTAAAPVHGQDSSDTNVTVEVMSTSPTATPSATTSASASASSSSSASSIASSSAGTTTPQASSTPSSSGNGTEEQSIGGVIYVSGITAEYAPSINPTAGTVTLNFTVRNVYTTAMDGSARLWVTTVFGGPVGIPVEVPVLQLKPGETRVVSAEITGLAQWTVVTAHATYTPPPKLGEVVLAPLTRETMILFLPWFVLVVAGLAGAEYWRRRRAQRRRRSGPPSAPGGPA